jgi:outer membrane protein insertion porin family
MDRPGRQDAGRWLELEAAFILGLATLSAATEVLAQAPTSAPTAAFDGRIIREIRIQGLERIDEGYVRNQIRTTTGQPYSARVMSEDVGRLLRTGRFLDVRATPEPVDGEVIVTIAVREKPVIAAIEIRGNVKFSTKDLLKDIDFGVGDPVDRFLINQGRDAIERKYRDAGYAYAEVTVDEEALKTEQRVIYTIAEGPRVRVRQITFEGNYSYKPKELMRLVSIKTYIWIFRTGEFDADKAQRDAENIQTFYREHGFLEAEVSYRPEFLDEAHENLRLVFVINEGTRYTIKEIRITGNTVFTTDDLLAKLKLHPGDFFDAFKLKDDVQAIETEYGRQGYIYAHVLPSRVFAEEPGQVIVTLQITEDGQFTMGRIEIHGNSQTQDKVVRRELRFYPGELYDTTKVREAEKRIKDTQLFTEATITPVGNAPDVRDALVQVTESTKTVNFILGAGVSSDSGLAGNIVLENTNFDLFDFPRSATEFFKGKSFRGAGQTARIQLEPGTQVQRFRIDFREPYLMDQPIGLSTSAYYFERNRGPYNEQRLGLTWGFDHRFESGALKGWTGTLGFRNEWVRITDVEFLAAKDIRDVEGGSYLSSVEPGLIHDTTDSVFNPTKGHRFKLGWEQAGMMGGAYTFSKITASYVQHWTVTSDEYERKSVLSGRINAGYMFGDTPVFERFYAGGIGSMRGFAFRGISPKDGLRNDRVGGDFMLLTGGEYSVPLYEKVIYGVGFVDMGTVERDITIDTWRTSIGLGVRLTLPFFGTVPMEFDFAIPVMKNDEDKTRIFSFYVGLPFF